VKSDECRIKRDELDGNCPNTGCHADLLRCCVPASITLIGDPRDKDPARYTRMLRSVSEGVAFSFPRVALVLSVPHFSSRRAQLGGVRESPQARVFHNVDDNLSRVGRVFQRERAHPYIGARISLAGAIIDYRSRSTRIARRYRAGKFDAPFLRLSAKTRSFALRYTSRILGVGRRRRRRRRRRRKGAVFAATIFASAALRRATHEPSFVRGCAQAIPPRMARNVLRSRNHGSAALRAGNFHDSARRKRAPRQEDPRNRKVCSLALLRALYAHGSTRG